MRFKVSNKIKGSFVLKTLGRPLMGGKFVNLEEQQMCASDIKLAVQKSILIPDDAEEYKKIVKEGEKVEICNTGTNVIIIEERPLSPRCKAFVNVSIIDEPYVKSMLENNFIEIVKQKKKTTKKKTTKKKSVKKTSKKKTSKKKTSKKKVSKKKEVIKIREEPDTTPVVFDMRAQEIKVAQKISNATNIVDIQDDKTDGEAKAEDIQVIKVGNKKKTVKKLAKRKTKKKGKATKKRKNKTIVPTGNVRAEKKEYDISIPLDSRGNPLSTKPSDVLKHMVEDLKSPDDINFIDEGK
jgi:hypothetical protein